MELRKNQSKYNIVDMSEQELYKLLSTIAHYNRSHVEVGRTDVFTSIDVPTMDIIPKSWRHDNLKDLKVLNPLKDDTPVNGQT